MNKMNKLDYILLFVPSFLACFFAVSSAFLVVDVKALRERLLEAECKYEAIDPIRAEAGVPMSDKCQCFWKEVTLEQLRRMKPVHGDGLTDEESKYWQWQKDNPGKGIYNPHPYPLKPSDYPIIPAG